MRNCITSILLGFAMLFFMSCTKDDEVSENNEPAAIEFCVFGTYCDKNGDDHYAKFRVDVWNYTGDSENPKGQLIEGNLINTIEVLSAGAAFAEDLCFSLPDKEGRDEYYLEIILLDAEGYEAEEEVVRKGVFTDEDVREIHDEAGPRKNFHFWAGSCSEGDSPDLFPASSTPPIEEGQQPVSGFVELPEHIDPTTTSLVSSSGSYEVQEDGSFNAAKSEEVQKQFLFVENEEGEVLLAVLTDSEEEVLNPSTTAEAMVALLPWTAFVERSDLQSLLDEVALLEEYDALVTSIENALENSVSPLTVPEVQEKLRALNYSITEASAEGKSKEGKNLKIPEVDYLVEPKIAYSDGNLVIRNDGTTTAAWGVEIYKDGSSVTDNLILPGNKVHFPSVSSLLSFFSGSLEDLVFTEGEPLVIPISMEGKYPITFRNPTSSELFNSSLAREAAMYNIAELYTVIFKAMGIFDSYESENPKAQKFLNQGCANSIFNSTTNGILDVMNEDDFDGAFVVDQVAGLISGSVQSLAECATMFDGFHGSTTTAKERYLKNLGNFLNAYSKVEAAFIVGKLVGDMLVLSDINICRQINQDALYPCFSLVKLEDFNNQVVEQGADVQLKVGTELDMEPEEETFPLGAEIFWEIVTGDGTLPSGPTMVGADGTTAVTYAVGIEENHVIKASVKDKEGNDIESIEYSIEAEPPVPVLSIVSGDKQEILPGDPSEPLKVHLTTEEGAPIAGKSIRWYVLGGDNLGNTTTDEDGYTEFTFSEETEGSYFINAAYDDADPLLHVEFLVEVIAEEPVLSIASGDNQKIAPGDPSEPLKVRLTTEEGNPIAGKSIRWYVLGGGNLENTTTDEDGYTKFTFSEETEGSYFIGAAYDDADPVLYVEFLVEVVAESEFPLCLQEGSGIYYNWSSLTSISSPNGFQNNLSGEIDGNSVKFSYWYSAGLAKYYVEYDLTIEGDELTGTRTECRTYSGSGCSGTPSETSANMKIISCD